MKTTKKAMAMQKELSGDYGVKPEPRHGCAETVGGVFYGRRCANRGTVLEDRGNNIRRRGELVKAGEQWFCAVHSAEGVAKREARGRAEREAKWQAHVTRSAAHETAYKHFPERIVKCTDLKQAANLVQEIRSHARGW